MSSCTRPALGPAARAVWQIKLYRARAGGREGKPPTARRAEPDPQLRTPRRREPLLQLASEEEDGHWHR